MSSIGVSQARWRMGMLLTAALSLALLTAGDAAASKIVYVCAPNLCVTNPDSGASSPIASDGAASPYRYPSISRDGRLLAAARGDDVVVGVYGGNLTERRAGTRDMNAVAIAPDGSGVGESHSYVENRYGCPFTGGCLELVDRSATFYTPLAEPAAGSREQPGGGGVGFLGNGALLSTAYELDDDTHRVCVVADPAAADAPCEPRVVSATALSSLAGSPDSRLIAATVAAPEPSDATSVVLFDAASGAPVRQLAAGGEPAFSPNGKQIAYAGPDGWIHVVATRGGRSRRLVRGLSPAWGGGDAPGPTVASRSLRYRNGRIAVKVRCAGRSTCRGTLRIKKGRTTIGSRSYRIKARKRATLAVTPTARGRRAIANAGRRTVAVRLEPRKGNGVRTKLTLRR